MTLNKIINLLVDYGNLSIPVILITLTGLVQLSPVSLNPWSLCSKLLKSFLKWLGNQMMEEVIGKVSNIESNLDDMNIKLQDVDRKIDLNRIKEIRWKILDFSNSLINRKRDREEYENIYKIHDEYLELLEKYGMTNGKVDRAMRNIDHRYQIQENEGTL